MKNIIIAYMSVLGMASAYAASDDVVNSQMYVDNLVGNLQTNLPAKTSEKVVTYTTTAGTTGERDIKTTLGNETTNTSDNGIPTAGTVKTAVDDKQNKLNPLNNVNIVTYTGSQNDSNNHKGRGIVTTTPIYDSTVNTFDNGLVTAKTLNDAVIAGVNAEATKITTDPKGALWVFNRTPPKVLPTTANLPTTINGVSRCYRNLNSTKFPDNQNACSATLYESMNRGDFGVVFTHNTGISYTCTGSTSCNKEISGISACINVEQTSMGLSISPDHWDSLQTIYNDCKQGCTKPSDYKYCYCKLANPEITRSNWVHDLSYYSFSECAKHCAINCALHTEALLGMRAAMFGAVPVSAVQSE